MCNYALAQSRPVHITVSIGENLCKGRRGRRRGAWGLVHMGVQGVSSDLRVLAPAVSSVAVAQGEWMFAKTESF
eukprot:3893282-Pleurochrysis_carterae.AAC.1